MHGQSLNAAIRPMVALAVVFMIAGLLGVFVVPATAEDMLILRGYGVGIAGLLLFGRHLWPGIVLGALASRVIVNWTGLSGLTGTPAMIDATVMSAAAALQPWVGAWAIHRLCGFPFRLTSWRQIARVLFIVLPIVCMIVPTVGTLMFSVLQPQGAANLAHHWVVWWVGDMIAFGLVVPVAVLGPWNKASVAFWRGVALPRFTAQAVAYLGLSVAVTFLAWHQVSRLGAKADAAQFETLARDTGQALKHRLKAYSLGIGGGVGLVQASDRVTRQDWQNYVASLNLTDSLSGLNGIGFIEVVTPESLPQFLARARFDGAPGLTITPEVTTDPMFVIKYIEPLARNRTALGLNIAFEKHRYSAAVAARDSGVTTITEPISLVQDETRGAGFLMLAPVYAGGTPPATVEARRAAFLGWVYAPIMARQMLDALTPSQNEFVRFTIYSGVDVRPERLLFTNIAGAQPAMASQFRIIDRLNVFGQTWTIVWQSTPLLETELWSVEPFGVLVGGLSFSMLLAFFLVNLIHREDLVRQTVTLRTRELAAQVEENRSIIENAVAKIALLDGRGNILRVNEALPRLLSHDPGNMIGKPMSSLLRGQLDEYFGQDHAPDHRYPYRGELDTISALGQRLVLDVQINPWRTSDGQWRYTAVMRNITEHRRISDQLHLTQRRLDLALTGAKIGVFDINLRDGSSIVSRTWRELLGYDPDDEIDGQAAWLQRIHPEDLPMVRAADQACIEGRAPRSVTEYRMRTADDTWRWMRSDAVGEEWDANGRAWRLIGLLSDVTDQRQVDELKNQFVSTVSHELRTPLTSINGSISLLLNAMSAGIPEPAKRMLQIAQKNCDRLILLVNDILDLEKLSSGPRKAKLAPADISLQVHRAIQVNQPFAARFDVSYELVRDAPGAMVMIEDLRFQQVMANLLSNAAKFSPRGGVVTVAIDRVEPAGAAPMIRVSVTDVGRGIPAEFHDRIFKPFSQVDGSSSRQAEGTGLGLHIARKTMEQMDGQIGFDSVPGVATTFWVTLTLPDAATLDTRPATLTSHLDPLPAAIPRILHVEDDRDFSEVLAAAFGSAADLVNAPDKATARDLMVRGRFDLIILDWHLRDGDSAALLDQLPVLQPGTEVVALTSAENRPEDLRVQKTFIKSRVQLDGVARYCLARISGEVATDDALIDSA